MSCRKEAAPNTFGLKLSFRSEASRIACLSTCNSHADAGTSAVGDIQCSLAHLSIHSRTNSPGFAVAQEMLGGLIAFQAKRPPTNALPCACAASIRSLKVLLVRQGCANAFDSRCANNQYFHEIIHQTSYITHSHCYTLQAACRGRMCCSAWRHGCGQKVHLVSFVGLGGKVHNAFIGGVKGMRS